jgi:hypothetical protein
MTSKVLNQRDLSLTEQLNNSYDNQKNKKDKSKTQVLFLKHSYVINMKNGNIKISNTAVIRLFTKM